MGRWGTEKWGIGGFSVGKWASAVQPFTFEVITAAADTFQLPLELTGTYDFIWKRGDGTSVHITQWDHADTNHQYTGAGTFVNEITGIIIGWRFNGHADATLVHKISSWGNLRIGNSGSGFSGCDNMTWVGSAIGGPDTANVINMSSLFSGCKALNQSIANMDTGSAENMSAMFFNCVIFDQDVSTFDTSSVTNMLDMFNRCTAFDQDVSTFDVGLVTNMSNMLYNSPISTANYDALILAFSEGVPVGVHSFGANLAKYTGGGAVEAARDAWIAKGWVITDGGIAP